MWILATMSLAAPLLFAVVYLLVDLTLDNLVYIYLFIYLSICLPNHLFIYLSTYSSIYLSIYLYLHTYILTYMNTYLIFLSIYIYDPSMSLFPCSCIILYSYQGSNRLEEGGRGGEVVRQVLRGHRVHEHSACEIKCSDRSMEVELSLRFEK